MHGIDYAPVLAKDDDLLLSLQTFHSFDQKRRLERLQALTQFGDFRHDHQRLTSS